MAQTDSEYGPEAQTYKGMRSLTEKQRNTIEAIMAAEPHATDISIAENAGVSNSYVEYVRRNFPHLIDQRREELGITPDDGDTTYEVTLTEDEVWTAIRELPDDVSEKIAEQVGAENR